MKKALATLLAIATLLVSEGWIYPTTFIITETDYDNDIVYVSTATGIEFSFYGVEDWNEGDLVSAIMWSNGTEKVYDDQILSTRYTSFDVFQ